MADRLKFTVSFGMTINRGNYNSVRLDLSKEFYTDEQEESTAFEYVKDLVEKEAEKFTRVMPA